MQMLPTALCQQVMRQTTQKRPSEVSELLETTNRLQAYIELDRSLRWSLSLWPLFKAFLMSILL